ncbi:MAG: FAD:protein FMN transferase [Alphaproteobacteria bacterium]|nr:FAD:protein FMN transferase [Alphaproteobacteria bacterium]
MSAANTRLHRRAFLALGGGTALSLALPRLSLGAPALSGLTGRAFSTEWSVAVPDGVDIAPLRPSIEALLAGIDRQMSPWRADSDVTRFNRAPAGTLKLPSELLHVAAAALALAATSAGEFDPTVGPLVSRWGFGPIEGDAISDWQRIGFRGDALAKPADGLTLDLCGIAKGYALDRMADLVKTAGATDFLIDLGGELSACGRHPSGRPWHVAVEDPRPGFSGAVDVLDLTGTTVATSGSRANSYQLGRRRYSHIIDPMTREPVDTDLLSVSVIAPDAMMADGWATALMAAGAIKGPALARQNQVDALFVLKDGDGLERLSTGTFGAYLA